MISSVSTDIGYDHSCSCRIACGRDNACLVVPMFVYANWAKLSHSRLEFTFELIMLPSFHVVSLVRQEGFSKDLQNSSAHFISHLKSLRALQINGRDFRPMKQCK